MPNALMPIVTQWYARSDSGELFEVVDVDESCGEIDIQDFMGEVVELTMQAWRELDLECTDAPDWLDFWDEYDSDLEIVNPGPESEDRQQLLHSEMH